MTIRTTVREGNRLGKTWEDVRGLERSDMILPAAEKPFPLTLDRFHNCLRLLLNIDRHELEAVGVIPEGEDGHDRWNAFRSNPFIFLIRADDAKAEAIWGIMQRRMR